VHARFDAWRNSVNVSAKTASSSTASTAAAAPVTGTSLADGWKTMSDMGFPVYPSGVAYKGMAHGGPQSGQNIYNQAKAKYGSLISPFGGMAEGGVITVPGGQSGTDSVDVLVKAAPGEKIFVVPPDKADALKQDRNAMHVAPQPLTDFIPAPTSIPGNDNAIATGSAVSAWKDSAAYHEPVAARAGAGGDQHITIVVQDKVQADDFIRSRAQIQGAMRGR